jgi:hypothetical protein
MAKNNVVVEKQKDKKKDKKKDKTMNDKKKDKKVITQNDFKIYF